MPDAYVMTVAGPIDPRTLGRVLPHEHLFANTMREYRGEGFVDDETVALNALVDYRRSGGQTVVDVTPLELGRKPEALRRLSLQSDVQLIMGCGHYRDPYIDRIFFDSNRTIDIADSIIGEIRHGVDGSGIRPGIIGEIGADCSVISAAEERSIRAAGIAHRETGLAISLHAARSNVGEDMLRILDEERVPRERVVVGHLDTVRDREYIFNLAVSGVFLEWDGFVSINDYENNRDIETLLALIGQGYDDQLLISHDAFLTSHFAEYGGPGFTRINLVILPRLSELGVSDETIHKITEANPQRLLAINT